MANSFYPSSLYVNYQPPPLRSDFDMPVPGWGWPADSAGPRRVGLGEAYDVNLPLYGKGSIDIPMSQIGADAANGMVAVLQEKLPGIIQSAQSEITMSILKGALVATAIGAVAVFGYKYVTGR